MSLVAAAQNPWQWQPHPEVWLLVALVIGLGFYVERVIAPTMVAAGELPISSRQKRFFWAGVFVLWAASDWPVHDFGEQYLFSVHMVQHLVLSFVLPPLFLLAIPAWLARLVIGKGRLGRLLLRLAKPVVAGLAFNLFVALSHWTVVVNHAITNGPFHFTLHLTLVLLAVMMWLPVCGPLPELRLPPLVQCAYLFLMSVIPTIPAAWLTFAERPVYTAYDRPYRLWGVSVIQDQQAAGLIMKLGGGAYLWTLIIIIFFRWAARHQAEEQRQRVPVARPGVVRTAASQAGPGTGAAGVASPAVADGMVAVGADGPALGAEVLTWEDVHEELQRLGPPPRDPTVP
jgi:putative membrane protein